MGSFIYAESSQDVGLNGEALVPYLILPYTKKEKLILLNGILEFHKVQNKCQIKKTIDQLLDQAGSISYFGDCAHLNFLLSLFLTLLRKVLIQIKIPI